MNSQERGESIKTIFQAIREAGFAAIIDAMICNQCSNVHTEVLIQACTAYIRAAWVSALPVYEEREAPTDWSEMRPCDVIFVGKVLEPLTLDIEPEPGEEDLDPLSVRLQ